MLLKLRTVPHSMLLTRKTNDSNCFILIFFRILEKKGVVHH